MREYKPSNLLAPQGIVFLIVAAIAGGVAIGLITYFVSTLIYLIVLFPIIMGLLAGSIISGAVILGKVRNPMIAMLFGVLIAVVLYGTYRYAEYEFGFRDDAREEFLQVLRDTADSNGIVATDEELEALLDEVVQGEAVGDYLLREETGSTGIVGFVKLSAQEGVTITSTRSTSPNETGLTLKDTVAYIYWLVEFAVIAGIAMSMARSRATTPFSEETREWYGKGEYLGTVPPQAVQPLIELLQQGNYGQAAQHINRGGNRPVPRTDVMVQRCSSPTADMLLLVNNVTQGRNGEQRSAIKKGLISPSEFDTIERAMRDREARAAAEA
jgi:hypothetical protein